MNHNRLYDLRDVLLSGSLFITEEEKRTTLLSLFPLAISESGDIPTYKEFVTEELTLLKQNSSINLTNDFSSDNLSSDSIAYHRIKGIISSSSYWWFSSKQFEQDLLLAEANPNINCHLVHITSGGGEAWYLDRLSETIRSLAKPFYVLIEKTCASAAYYIGCHGIVVKALTQNDTIGCIGTMVGYWDIDGYLESIGFKKIEEYATRSDLKNKKYNDLKNGKPEQFIQEELNPLQKQFEDEIYASRKRLQSLDTDHPVFRGETFMASVALEIGLIDGISTFSEAVKEAHELGMQYRNKQSKRNRALTLI